MKIRNYRLHYWQVWGTTKLILQPCTRQCRTNTDWSSSSESDLCRFNFKYFFRCESNGDLYTYSNLTYPFSRYLTKYNNELAPWDHSCLTQVNCLHAVVSDCLLWRHLPASFLDFHPQLEMVDCFSYCHFSAILHQEQKSNLHQLCPQLP